MTTTDPIFVSTRLAPERAEVGCSECAEECDGR